MPDTFDGDVRIRTALLSAVLVVALFLAFRTVTTDPLTTASPSPALGGGAIAWTSLHDQHIAVFEPARFALVRTGEAPGLDEALRHAVEIDGADAAINASFVRLYGPEAGATRGAVVHRGEVLDPPEGNSGDLWTLEISADGRLSAYPGEPDPDAWIAIGGLESVLHHGTPGSSPTVENQRRRGIDGQTGRTWLAWGTDTPRVALAVLDHGDTGPSASVLQEWLVDQGFDEAVLLDGGPSSALWVRQGQVGVPIARARPPRGSKLPFGLAFWIRR